MNSFMQASAASKAGGARMHVHHMQDSFGTLVSMHIYIRMVLGVLIYCYGCVCIGLHR